MDGRVDSVLTELRARGVARLAGAAAPSIVERLQLAAADLRRREAESWEGAARWFAESRWRPAHFAGDGRNANFYDVLGVDPRLDGAVEELLASTLIRDLLDRALGADYRLWFAQLRWAEPDGEEYVLHQDVYGELGICLYLSDHPDDGGSMVLWPGSHRWPRALEALPPLLPKFVKERLVSIEGRAGDACVFLNKTWHGRTTAREPRLVMLLSFIPPGPSERARRPTESHRAAFGPQVRRVTDPQAGRSFEDHPPATLPFSSTFELPSTIPPECTFSNHGERAIVDYAWAWCVAHAEPSLDAERGALLRFRWLVQELVPYGVVPNSLLAALQERLRQRGDRLGASRRAWRFARMAQRAWNGDADLARRELAEATALPRDWLSSCAACEVDAIVRFHAELGEDTQALAAARPLLDGELGCDRTPDVTIAALLAPLERLGRRDEAARLHARTWPRSIGRADRFVAIGLHLRHLARGPDLDAAIAAHDGHLPMALAHRCDGDLWHFWSGAWLLLARLARRGMRTFDDATTAECRLVRLATRMDLRNRNEHRARLLRALRDEPDVFAR
jgi:hypothetical protein